MKILIKIPKPVCRTPIKPAQRHRIETKYIRQPKHRQKENYAY
jgi:hypothetical protein